MPKIRQSSLWLEVVEETAAAAAAAVVGGGRCMRCVIIGRGCLLGGGSGLCGFHCVMGKRWVCSGWGQVDEAGQGRRCRERGEIGQRRLVGWVSSLTVGCGEEALYISISPFLSLKIYFFLLCGDNFS